MTNEPTTRPAPISGHPALATVGDASNADCDLAIVNFDLLEQEARKTLSSGRFAFLGPAGDGWTYSENRRAFNDYPLLPHRLQGVSEQALSPRVLLLGHELSLPIIASPIGIQGMIHSTGELATASGTCMAGTLFVVSGASTQSMEDVARSTAGPKWFQIYMNRDMGVNRWLVQRAKAAGYSAIVLTADALAPGQSDEFIRLGRPFPLNITFGNHDPALGGWGNILDLKLDLGFDDIQFLQEAADLPIVVKGLMRAEDVKQAVASGVAAVWVSNHGGRQIDGVPATITVLRSAVDAVEGRVPVILDGGIRRGTDVLKALAIGATVVGIGRPLMWASAVGGAQGVKSAFAYMAAELKAAMLLSGVAKVKDVKRDLVAVKS